MGVFGFVEKLCLGGEICDLRSCCEEKSLVIQMIDDEYDSARLGLKTLHSTN